MVNRLTKRHGRSRKDKKKSSTGFSFRYKQRPASTVKQRAEQSGRGFDSPIKQGFDTWRPKVGDNLIRFLPPTWKGEHQHFGYDVWVHRNIGPDNATYLCPRKMGKDKCPLCEEAKEAQDAGETDEAKDLQPKQLVVSWIVDRSDDDLNPQIYMMSPTMDRDIAVQCENTRTREVLLIDHPDEGYDVSFRRQGQGLRTKYFGVKVDRDPTPIADDEDKQREILEYISANPIPDALNFYSPDYLERVYSGEVQQKDEDLDDDEDRPKKKKKKKKSDDSKDKKKKKKKKKLV